MKMKLHLQTNTTPPLVGRESFDTFLQIAEQLTKHAVDDLSLSVQNDRLKTYVCWIKPEEGPTLTKLLSRYASMKLAVMWLEKAFTDSMRKGLYYSLQLLPGGDWQVQYGLTDGSNLYVIGQFALDMAAQKFPVSAVTKHFIEDMTPWDPKALALLDAVRKDIKSFDPGPCSLPDAQVVDNTVTQPCHMLGTWNKGQTLEWAEGEAEKYLKVYQQWVRSKSWWQEVELVLRIVGNGWVYFVVKPKKKTDVEAEK